MIRKAVLLGCMGVLLLAPQAAFAITVDQVVALARSGVTDTVILALIDRDRTVFAIEPEQIVSLKRDGLSEPVILAMLKSGRAEGDQAARADAAANSAWIASNLATEPEMVTVGHGPDRPNTPHIDGFYSGPPAGGFYSAGFYGATPWIGSSVRTKVSRRAVTTPVAIAPPALCYAQISTARSAFQTPFVTVCPDAMQPRRERR